MQHPWLIQFSDSVAITNQKEDIVISTKQLNNQNISPSTAAVTNNERNQSEHKISLAKKKLS